MIEMPGSNVVGCLLDALESTLHGVSEYHVPLARTDYSFQEWQSASAFSSLLSAGLPVGLPSALASLLTQISNSTGNSCTITIGNEILDGTPAGDVQGGATGLSMADATKPVTFTTQNSGNLSGRPVTGVPSSFRYFCAPWIVVPCIST